MAALVGIGVLIAFAMLFAGVQVTATQQQTTPAETHQMHNNNNLQSTNLCAFMP